MPFRRFPATGSRVQSAGDSEPSGLRRERSMTYLQIFWLFTRVALLSWGGGPASLALMQRETVSAGWVTPDEFADAVALGNSLPGPIAPQASAFVGYKLAGFWGAVAGAAGTVVPTTLLMLAAIVYFYGIKDSPAVKAMLQAVRPGVIGFLRAEERR